MRSTVPTTSLAHRAQLAHAGVRVGERDVDLGADDRQRAAQLVARVGHEALAGGERLGRRGELPPRERPPEGRGDEGRAGERDQVLRAQLRERRAGVGRRQRALEVLGDQPVGRAQDDRHEDDEQAAVERGEPGPQRGRHTR